MLPLVSGQSLKFEIANISETLTFNYPLASSSVVVIDYSRMFEFHKSENIEQSLHL